MLVRLDQRQSNLPEQAIRQGLVELGRMNAKEQATIFVPSPDWTPADGHEALVPVTVEKISDGVALCKDESGAVWGLWL